MVDQRLQAANTWLSSLSHLNAYTIQPLAGDASFRRYFRVSSPHETYVLMDAPPTKEDMVPFLRVCSWLEKAGIHAPKILHQDQQLGFLLLEDFGDTTWAVYLSQNNDITPLFKDALQQLHTLQSAAVTIDLPLFDTQRMQTEANLYLDWYLPHIKGDTPDQKKRDAFHQTLSTIFANIDQIPKAPVHLDYHSRNLMLQKAGLPLGVIDFQDAVLGPITYDLASLLYDCYQDYPEKERQQWSLYFFKALPQKYQVYFNHDFNTWHHMLRLTALQRHIKAMGIFARLAFRDGKKQFLHEIPLTKKHLDDELQALTLHIPLLNS